MTEPTEQSIEQLNLFATPLWKVETGLDCKPIKTLVYKIKDKYESNKVTNQGGWQSPSFSTKDLSPTLGFEKGCTEPVILAVAIPSCTLRILK